MTADERDNKYVEVFLVPVRKCAQYRPAFGQEGSRGLKVAEFQQLYGNDSFYHWLGLDDPSVYAAHKAAGGLTSVYRQIGVGSERLFREVLRDSLSLTDNAMKWGYEYQKSERKKGVHTLDARIRTSDLKPKHQQRFTEWLRSAKHQVAPGAHGAVNADGVVFEVRQGYKSADSKRQNADLRFGVHAYQASLLPAFAVMSSQVSEPVIKRYRADGMLVLTGTPSTDPTISTFAFFDKVVGYDLAGFFSRNSGRMKNEIHKIAAKLLSP